ncbi:MAG: D-alanine--D-alanine ligase family protein [Acidimicrobiales bacterium]
MIPPKVRLVVLFGGRSAEHDVSCVSASHVLRAVDPERYEVIPVGITREGRWITAEAAAALVGAHRQAELPAAIAIEGPDTDPLTSLGDAPLGTVSSLDAIPTVVLPILHGPNGEDGTIQGLLEVADLPYAGSGVLGSSVSMDKVMAKTVLGAAGIAQARWRSLTAVDRDRPDLADHLLADLGRTVFVKPANMGSSIGVSKATGAAEVEAALDHALAYDELIVVEEAITGRELECGVLGNLDPRASAVGEIVTDADFYDFDDKYTDGTAQTIVPADIPDDVAEQVRLTAVRAFTALRAEGLARVDVFWEESGHGILVNEINTMPGFTPISMFPMLWAHSGIPYPQLIDELVALALERHARRSGRSTERSTP